MCCAVGDQTFDALSHAQVLLQDMLVIDAAPSAVPNNRLPGQYLPMLVMLPKTASLSHTATERVV